MRHLDTIYLVSAVNKREDLTEHALNALTRQKIDFNPMLGCYEGTKEHSFLVLDKKVAINMMMIYDQESVLEADHERFARLIYRDGTIKDLGYLVEVSEKEALQHDSWTYRPDTRQYFVTKKEK